MCCSRRLYSLAPSRQRNSCDAGPLRPRVGPATADNALLAVGAGSPLPPSLPPPLPAAPAAHCPPPCARAYAIPTEPPARNSRSRQEYLAAPFRPRRLATKLLIDAPGSSQYLRSRAMRGSAGQCRQGADVRRRDLLQGRAPLTPTALCCCPPDRVADKLRDMLIRLRF